jgi:hypothetical protein
VQLVVVGESRSFRIEESNVILLAVCEQRIELIRTGNASRTLHGVGVKSCGVVFRGSRVILWLWSGAERREVVVGGHLRGGAGGGGRDGDAGAGEYVEAEVAASFGPLVVLLGQDRADEPDQGVAAGEDADDVGPPADLAVQPLLYPALVAGASRGARVVSGLAG